MFWHTCCYIQHAIDGAASRTEQLMGADAQALGSGFGLRFHCRVTHQTHSLPGTQAPETWYWPAVHVADGAPASGDATNPSSQLPGQMSPDVTSPDEQVVKLVLEASGAAWQGSAATHKQQKHDRLGLNCTTNLLRQHMDSSMTANTGCHYIKAAQ